jgi:multidrug efflux system outer membrane protein
MRTAALTLIAAVLSGCSFAPTYDRPAAPIPGTWSAASSASAASVQSLHWKDFVIDERLRSRIETALANNRDLRQTLLNVQTARAAYRVQRADQLPGLEAQAGGNRQRLPADLSGTGAARVQSNYQAGAGLMAFELDLFGRVRSLSEAALMEYLATEEAARSVQISLVAEVIQASLAQDSARQRHPGAAHLAGAREGMAADERARKTGTASRLDEQEAQGQLELARAEVERFERELRQAATHWTGWWAMARCRQSWIECQTHGAGDWSRSAVRAAGAAPRYPRRRISAALAQCKHWRGAGRVLSAHLAHGLLWLGQCRASDLFAGGQRSWSFMPQLSLPIFDGGRNRANLEIAQLRKDMAVASYERSIQTAFREVSDALASVETLRREELARQRLVQTSANTLKLAELRYRAGVDSHLRYLDAQRTDFAQQMALIEVSAQRQMALATLFKAWAAAGASGWLSVAGLVARQPASREPGRREQSGAAGARARTQSWLFLRVGGGKTACWLARPCSPSHSPSPGWMRGAHAAP